MKKPAGRQTTSKNVSLLLKLILLLALDHNDHYSMRCWGVLATFEKYPIVHKSNHEMTYLLFPSWVERFKGPKMLERLQLVDSDTNNIIGTNIRTSDNWDPIRATSMAVDEFRNALFVAYHVDYQTKVLFRYNGDGTNPTEIYRLRPSNGEYIEEILDILLAQNLIIINHPNRRYGENSMATLDIRTNQLFDQNDGGEIGDPMYGLSIASSKHRIYGHSAHDVQYVEYSPTNGSFVASEESRYHYRYSGADFTWMNPFSQEEFLDSTGHFYSTTPLNEFVEGYGTWYNAIPYVASIAVHDHIIDVEWIDSNTFLVLDTKSITLFGGSRRLPLGSLTLQATSENDGAQNVTKPVAIRLPGAGQIGIGGGDLDTILFFQVVTDMYGEAISLAPVQNLSLANDLQPAKPQQPFVSPVHLTYTPDSSFLRRSLLYLFSKEHHSIFVWNAATQEYTSTTIALLPGVQFVVYDPIHDVGYALYKTGLLRRIDIGGATDDSSVDDIPFAQIAEYPVGLTMVGENVLCVQKNLGHSENRYDMFDPNGKLLPLPLNYDPTIPFSNQYIWNDATERLFFIETYTYQNSLYRWGFTGGKVTDYYWGQLPNYEQWEHPFRVNLDGTLIVDGSGRLFDGVTLTDPIAKLTDGPLADATFVPSSSSICTFKNYSNDMTLFELFQEDATEMASLAVPGNSSKVQFASESDLLVGVAVHVDGIPSFYVLDPSTLDVIPPIELPQPEPIWGCFNSTTQELQLQWYDISGETGYYLQMSATRTGNFETIATLGISETWYKGRMEKIGGYYRVQAFHTDDEITARNNAISSAAASEPTYFNESLRCDSCGLCEKGPGIHVDRFPFQELSNSIIEHYKLDDYLNVTCGDLEINATQVARTIIETSLGSQPFFGYLHCKDAANIVRPLISDICCWVPSESTCGICQASSVLLPTAMTTDPSNPTSNETESCFIADLDTRVAYQLLHDVRSCGEFREFPGDFLGSPDYFEILESACCEDSTPTEQLTQSSTPAPTPSPQDETDASSSAASWHVRDPLGVMYLLHGLCLVALIVGLAE